MNKVKRFLSTTIVYLIGNVLSKLVVFFLLPLYTSRIAPDQYGIYDLMMTLVTLLAPIAFFQVWDGMFRAAFDYEDKESKYTVISNSLFISGIGIAIYLVGFAVVYAIFRFEYALYILLYGLFLSINYLYGYVCRVFLANSLYAFSGLINTIVTTVLNVVLIVCFHWDVRSLYFAPVVGMLVQIVIIECKYRVLARFSRKVISKELIRKLLKFSIPLCVVGASYWLLSGFTKLLITGMLGAADNGLFAIANRFATMVTLIVTIFQFAWNEMAYMMANDKNRVDSYNICIDMLLKFVILGGAAVCIFIKILFPYLIDEQYALAIHVIPATILGSMMNAMASFVATLFMAEKKTNSIVYSILIAAAVNIGLGFLLTKYFGLQGATIALAVAFTLLMLMRLFQAKKTIHIALHVKEILLFLGIMALAVVEYYLVDNVWIDVLTLLAIGVIFLVSVRKYIFLLFKKNTGIEENTTQE